MLPVFSNAGNRGKKWAAENGIELFSGLNAGLEQYARPEESIAFYSRGTYSRQSFCRTQSPLFLSSSRGALIQTHIQDDCKFPYLLANRNRIDEFYLC